MLRRLCERLNSGIEMLKVINERRNEEMDFELSRRQYYNNMTNRIELEKIIDFDLRF